ncbi:hypothetical protein ABG067_006047 [Albugo candida]
MRAPLLIGVSNCSHALEQSQRKEKSLKKLRKIYEKEHGAEDIQVDNPCYLKVSVRSWNLYTALRDYLATMTTKTKLMESPSDCLSHLLSVIASAAGIPRSERVEQVLTLCTDTLTLYKVQLHASAPCAIVALVTYAPSQYFPFCWSSSRRAVRFVHGVAALVTLNAYVSTLGGGHFLCKHINQARLMARLQIAISVGLQDPILRSKCRIHLAYNAIQIGQFRRAFKIIRREARVAEELESEELQKVCHAAKTYGRKVYRLLHGEHNVVDTKSSIQSDSFYRQRIVAET